MSSFARFNWSDLVDATMSEPATHHRHFEPVAIETDTRQLENNPEVGDLFYLPIVGQQFNGNQFIEQAYQYGVAGSFVSQDYYDAHPELSRFPNLLVVPNTTVAYLQLGNFHRKRMSAEVIAITGSSGKTTTKEMLAQLLSVQHKVQFTQKNNNNEIGVAQTLLNLEPDTQYLIVEVAMRALGEIALLAKHVEPRIGVITNVGQAHIGILGSMETIAHAKTELLDFLPADRGVAILNGDDSLLMRISEQRWNGLTEPFSLHDIENIKRRNPQGHFFDYHGLTFELGVPGTHNIMNLLACLKVCEVLGVRLKPLVEALAKFDGGGGRWQEVTLSPTLNIKVINDAYNANPSSMRAAIMSLWELQVPGVVKVAVLGHMAELGDFAPTCYQDLAEWLASHERPVKYLFVGQQTFGWFDMVKLHHLDAYWVETVEAATEWLSSQISQNALVLLKASREAQLDTIIPTWQAKLPTQPTTGEKATEGAALNVPS